MALLVIVLLWGQIGAEAVPEFSQPGTDELVRTGAMPAPLFVPCEPTPTEAAGSPLPDTATLPLSAVISTISPEVAPDQLPCSGMTVPGLQKQHAGAFLPRPPPPYLSV